MSERSDESAYVSSQIQSLIPVYNESDYPLLAPEEILFVYQYLASGNDSGKAYTEVYGETDTTKARSKAMHLLKDKRIMEAVNVMQESIFQYALHSLPMALMVDIQNIRDMDIQDFYDDSGNSKPLSLIPSDKRRLIENVNKTINNKTGDVITTYVLPKKSDVTAQIISLLKMRTLSSGTENAVDESAAIKEAKINRAAALARLEEISNVK
jgi:hypothetical protein